MLHFSLALTSSGTFLLHADDACLSQAGLSKNEKTNFQNLLKYI